MIASIRLLVLGCVIGFCYSLVSNAFKLLPAMNVLDAVTLGFAFSLAALVWFVIAALLVAAVGFCIAVLSLFAPLVALLAAIVRPRSVAANQILQRARVNRLYTLPPHPRLRL